MTWKIIFVCVSWSMKGTMECNHGEDRTNAKIKTKRQTCLARLQARFREFNTSSSHLIT
jgi:hypothetical protein